MTKSKPTRKRVPQEVEFAVLAKSARRCSLCFRLKGDLTEKLGQIAHLDKNSANSIEDNLVWMCLEHHSLYDSTTKQHKNYTMPEVKAARAELYRLVEEGEYLQPTVGRRHLQADRETLHDLMRMVPSNGTIELLRRKFGSSFRWGWLKDIKNFYCERGGPDHEFLDPELETSRQKFRESCKKLLGLLARETWSIRQEDWHAVPDEWKVEQPERFSRVLDEIHAAVDSVCSTYKDLVRLARKNLEK